MKLITERSFSVKEGVTKNDVIEEVREWESHTFRTSFTTLFTEAVDTIVGEYEAGGNTITNSVILGEVEIRVEE